MSRRRVSPCSMGIANIFIHMSGIKGCPQLSGVQLLMNYSNTHNNSIIIVCVCVVCVCVYMCVCVCFVLKQ